MNRSIHIIGAGIGHSGLLTKEVKQIIQSADEVYANGRISGTFVTLRKDWRVVPVNDMKELAIESKKKNIALLVEGDASFFDNGQELYNGLKEYANVKYYAGINSVQYLCAKTNQSYDNIHWFEYGKEDLLAAISYNRKVAVLLNGDDIPDKICKLLCESGLSNIKVTVGSKLATGRERIEQDEANLLRDYEFVNPSVVIIENHHFKNPSAVVFDKELKINENSLTQETRWNGANLLFVQPMDNILNIGAGCGEMAIELARKAYKGHVVAIEEDKEEYDMLEHNKKQTGAYNITALFGNALEMLEHNVHIIPDCVFIGENVRGIKNILQSLKNKNDRIRVVIMAHSLERVAHAQNALSSLNFDCVNVSQISISKNKKLGRYNMMLASDTVFFIYA